MNWGIIVGAVTPEMFLAWLLLTVFGWLVFDGVRSVFRSVFRIVHEFKGRGVVDE